MKILIICISLIFISGCFYSRTELSYDSFEIGYRKATIDYHEHKMFDVGKALKWYKRELKAARSKRKYHVKEKENTMKVLEVLTWHDAHLTDIKIGDIDTSKSNIWHINKENYRITIDTLQGFLYSQPILIDTLIIKGVR